MRAYEFLNETSAGTVTSGSIAPVSHAIGQPITRTFTAPKTKYENAYKKSWPQRITKNAR